MIIFDVIHHKEIDQGQVEDVTIKQFLDARKALEYMKKCNGDENGYGIWYTAEVSEIE